METASGGVLAVIGLFAFRWHVYCSSADVSKNFAESFSFFHFFLFRILLELFRRDISTNGNSLYCGMNTDLLIASCRYLDPEFSQIAAVSG